MSRELNAAEQAQCDAVVDGEVAAWPPLRPAQITRLTALFDYQPPEGGGST